MNRANIRAQYGEEKILLRFFNEKRGGFVLDVGASDGSLNSNSFYLINELGWSGLLVEPLPDSVRSLHTLYDKNLSVKICPMAVSKSEGKIPIHVFGISVQMSTTDDGFRQLVKRQHGDHYYRHILVRSAPLGMILLRNNCPKHIDFFSLDVEGSEFVALDSIDWSVYSFGLICVEHSMEEQSLIDKMKRCGYVCHARTRGNTFFKKTPV